MLHRNEEFQRGLQSICTFVIHQFIGTYGVVWLSTFLASAVGNLLTHLYGLFGHSFSMRPLYWIMTETPYFPVQIAMGLCLGWVVYRRLRHRSMLWIWVIPFAILGYALFVLPLSPETTSVFNQSGIQSRLSHYFGWGCNARDRCLDQIIVTLPSYAAAAYSIGAAVARKTNSNSKDVQRQGSWFLRGFKLGNQ
jgi:hypothetical protein